MHLPCRPHPLRRSSVPADERLGCRFIMGIGLRRHQRKETDRKVRLMWTGEGGQSLYARARCVDISQSGMRVDCPEPIPVRTFVNFQIDGTKFEGSASVRSCGRQGLRHLLGLEFGSGLKWDPERYQQPPACSGS
ncbi:MAG: PilZ domain-containing protein [Bryobacteraceae bacterium]